MACGAGEFARWVLVRAGRVGKSSNLVVVVAAAAAVGAWKVAQGGKSNWCLQNTKARGWCCLGSWGRKSRRRCWRAAGYGLLRER